MAEKAQDSELCLANITESLLKHGATKMAAKVSDELEKQVIAKGKSSTRKRYVSPEGYFKGKSGSGERFDNCVAYQKSQGKSDEAAHKICGAIARGKGYGKPGHKPGTK